MEDGSNCQRKKAELVARTDATKAIISARANRHRNDSKEEGDGEQKHGSRSASFVVPKQRDANRTFSGRAGELGRPNPAQTGGLWQPVVCDTKP